MNTVFEDQNLACCLLHHSPAVRIRSYQRALRSLHAIATAVAASPSAPERRCGRHRRLRRGGVRPGLVCPALAVRATALRAGFTDAERIAEAIAPCGVLNGRTKAEVRTLIGRPETGRHVWRWSVGWVNDALGPGDGQELVVAFDQRGRARTVRLSPP